MALGGLRGRIALIFLLVLLATGFGLHQLLVRVTREWLVVELGSRGRAISMQLAERSVTPLLVGDRARLRREFATTHDVDLVGVAAYDRAGRLLARAMGDSAGASAWRGQGWDSAIKAERGPPADRAGSSCSVSSRRSCGAATTPAASSPGPASCTGSKSRGRPRRARNASAAWWW